MFNNKKKDVILWNKKIPECDYDFSDFFIKAKSNLPEWWLKIPSEKYNFVGTIKNCPSFLDIFKNSFIFKSPFDIAIQYNKQDLEFYHGDRNVNLMGYDSHTDFRKNPSQMGSYWDRDLQNLKMSPGLLTYSKNTKIKYIMMPSTFWNPKFFMQPVPGTVDLLPKITLDMSVNFFLNIQDTQKVTTTKHLIKADEPLALFYFPNGLPQVEFSENVKPIPRKKLVGDYLINLKNFKEVKKCPFKF